MNLQLFAFTPQVTPGSMDVQPVNVTKQESLSATMKTFYDTTLLENARESMVFTQFGKKQPMKGNKVEWRKFNTFKKAMTPLQEGVIPTGQNFGMTSIEAETSQHGDFTAVSDRLELESYDDVIFGATEEMGAVSGETYDTLTRNVLVAGNSVMYAENTAEGMEGEIPTDRHGLETMCLMTPKMLHKAAVWLKKNKAPKIDGAYVALMHPSVAYDLKESKEWKEFHKYNAVEPIFKDEVGMMHGVRVIETNEAKIWDNAGPDGSEKAYCTLVLGKDAFGVLDPQGEGMEMIIKTKGQIGGPLEQFSTIGYKFCHGAKILYQERMLRIESRSTLAAEDEVN